MRIVRKRASIYDAVFLKGRVRGREEIVINQMNTILK